MKFDVDIISKMPLFEGFSSEETPSVLEKLGAKECAYKKDQVIFSEGDDATSFGMVLEGSVSIIRNDYFGNRNIMLSMTSPAMFAEALACTGQKKFPVSIVADCDTLVLIIPDRSLFGDSRLDSETKDRLYLNLMKIMAKKNLMFRHKVDILSQRSTQEKLMYYLNSQAVVKGSSTIEIPYDRQELADYLGVERSALSAVIGKLRDEGIIESRKNQFTLL